jgi:hypothetical protein
MAGNPLQCQLCLLPLVRDFAVIGRYVVWKTDRFGDEEELPLALRNASLRGGSGNAVSQSMVETMAYLNVARGASRLSFCSAQFVARVRPWS